MRMVRFGQKQFMEWDVEMTHNTEDLSGAPVEIPAQVRSMDQNDDCGQISHIFSDKTGTLTQNLMEFRKCR